MEASWGVLEPSWGVLEVSWDVLGCLGGFLLKNIEKLMNIKGFLRFLVIREGDQGVGPMARDDGFPAREYSLFHLKPLKSIVFF